MENLTCLVSILSMVAMLQAVSLNGVCTADPDCTTANAFCDKKFSNCDNKGECSCKSGYASDGTNCKLQIAYGSDCTASALVCKASEGTVCDTTCKCAATTHEWSTIAQKCITKTKKVVADECTTASDCDLPASTFECTANCGTASPKYCRCLTGYITDNYSCRKPYYNEACTSVGCVKQVTLDANQEVETCQSSICKCPSTATEIRIGFKSVNYDVCYTTYTGTKKPDNATCTSGNECSSSYCYSCPGTTAKSCLRPIVTGRATSLSTFNLVSLLLVSLTLLCE